MLKHDLVVERSYLQLSKLLGRFSDIAMLSGCWQHSVEIINDYMINKNIKMYIKITK